MSGLAPARILSLNIGLPRAMEWEGRSVTSSMLKTPVTGPLIVHRENVDGDRFASPEFHGTPDSVLYAFGMPSLLAYMRSIGRDGYDPGALGENLTLDDFDEQKISVGDVFEIGEVTAQATFPRIPCAKVNFRMGHPEGQKKMIELGRSGVYFRILKPGKISKGDSVVRVREAEVKFWIPDLYRKACASQFTQDDLRLARENGFLPRRFMEKWEARLA